MSKTDSDRINHRHGWIIDVVQLIEVIEDYADERDPYREPFDLSQMKYNLMTIHYREELEHLQNIEVETVGGVFEGTRLDDIPHIEYIILAVLGVIIWALFTIFPVWGWLG